MGLHAKMRLISECEAASLTLRLSSRYDAADREINVISLPGFSSYNIT